MKIYFSKLHYGVLLLLIFILGLFFRFRVEDPMFYDDSFDYFLRAIELFTNGTHSLTYWPIGYSLILASSFYFLGESIHSAHIITAFLGALIVFPVYFLAREILDKKIAILAALLIAIDPVHILISSGIWSNAPETLFITAAIYFIVKYSKLEEPYYLYASSIFCGLSILIRYTSGILIIIIIIYLIFSKSIKNISQIFKKKTFYFACLIFIIMLTPQLIHNTVEFGSPLKTYYSANTENVYWNYRYLFETPPNMQYPTTITYAYTILFWTFDLKSPLFFLSKSTFVSPLLSLFAIVGFILLYKEKKYPELILLSFWIILTIGLFLFFIQSTLWQSSRLLLSIHPPFIIIGIFGIFKSTEMLNQRLAPLFTLRRNYASILRICCFLLIIIPMIFVSILIKPPKEGSFGKKVQKHFDSPANNYVIFSVERHLAFKDSHTWIKLHRTNETLVIGEASYKERFYAGEMYPLNTHIDTLEEQIKKANESYIIVSIRKNEFVESPKNVRPLLEAYNFSLIKSYDANFDEEKWQIYYRKQEMN